MSATGDPELPAEEFQQVPAGNPNDGGWGATKRGWRGEAVKAQAAAPRRPSSGGVPLRATSRPRSLRKPERVCTAADRVGSASLHPPGLPYLREGVRLHSPDG